MTGTEFATYIRTQTRTNSTTFPNADIVAYANIKMDILASKITEANENYFGIFMQRNLEADKRNYAFETTQLNHMKYLEAQLDGTNWSKLKEYDIHQLGITTGESAIREYFTGITPGFTILGNELYILSGDAIIDVTNGLKLQTIIYPKHISESDLSGSVDLSVPPSATEFGLPRQFHELWADAVVIQWKNSQPKPIKLNRQELKWDITFAEVLGEIKGQNLDRSFEAQVPHDDGSDY